MFEVFEDQLLFEPFGVLSSTDADIGENAVSYYFITGTPDNRLLQ